MKHADIKLFAQIGISAAILLLCGWIILSGRYQDNDMKWAYGMLGVVVGYWLK